eukprot:scaffold8606_cov117-Isochrysis_galbana.AAC.2
MGRDRNASLVACIADPSAPRPAAQNRATRTLLARSITIDHSRIGTRSNALCHFDLDLTVGEE